MKFKQNTTNFIFIAVCIMNFNLLFSQRNSDIVAAASSIEGVVAEPSKLMHDRHLWKEDLLKRTQFSSSYVKPDGKVIIEYSKLPINYLDSKNKYEPIVVIPTLNFEGDLVASNQMSPVTLKHDGSVDIKVSENSHIIFSKHAKINGISAKTTSFTYDSTNAKLLDVFPNITKVFDYKLCGVKYNYIINKPILKIAKDLIIEEEVLIPKDAALRADPNFGLEGKNGWEGHLSIVTKDNKEIGRIYDAYCYDAKGAHCTAGYMYEKVDGVYKLKITVPDSWINDPTRTYPITVDPLVTGPTSEWIGPASTIPSCVLPAFESDSILITIPAQITLTGMFVNGSFTCMNGAVGKHGSNSFKTKCGKIGPFTLAFSADPFNPYNINATGFADLYEARNPLTCCIPQSCSTQTFYLVMQVGRTYTAGVAGCHDLYVYHDRFNFDLRTRFKCFVEGHTTEQGLTSASWKVQPSSICSNVCQVVGTVYMKYGTPPYTITHPWNPTTYTVGTAVGCSSGFTTKTMTLTVPDCPTYCGVDGTFSVPTPTVIDACGNNAVVGLLPVTLSVVATPTVSASPNPAIACHDVPFNINLNSCIPTSTISWSGNGASGSTGNNLTDTILNLTGAVSSTTYIISANNKGCISEPYNLVINTDPKPIANYSVEPEPSKALLVSTFTDASTVVGSTAVKWAWSVSKTVFSNNQTSYFKFDNPGAYNVCLAIESEHGCRDTLCRDVNVIVASITLPNVITPNGDGVNDFLKINYLDFFGTNNLKIYDRWGKLVYEKQNYDNKWNGDKVSDGTFFLVLVVDDKSYSGFLQVFHK